MAVPKLIPRPPQGLRRRRLQRLGNANNDNADNKDHEQCASSDVIQLQKNTQSVKTHQESKEQNCITNNKVIMEEKLIRQKQQQNPQKPRYHIRAITIGHVEPSIYGQVGANKKPNGIHKDDSMSTRLSTEDHANMLASKRKLKRVCKKLLKQHSLSSEKKNGSVATGSTASSAFISSSSKPPLEELHLNSQKNPSENIKDDEQQKQQRRRQQQQQQQMVMLDKVRSELETNRTQKQKQNPQNIQDLYCPIAIQSSDFQEGLKHIFQSSSKSNEAIGRTTTYTTSISTKTTKEEQQVIFPNSETTIPAMISPSRQAQDLFLCRADRMDLQSDFQEGWKHIFQSSHGVGDNNNETIDPGSSNTITSTKRMFQTPDGNNEEAMGKSDFGEGWKPIFQCSHGGGDNNDETIDLGSTTIITSTKRMFQPPDGDNEEAMGKSDFREGWKPIFQCSHGGGDNNNETIDLGSITTITSTKRMFRTPDGDNAEGMGKANFREACNPTFQSSPGGGDNNNEMIDHGSTTAITSTKRMLQPPDGDDEEAMGKADFREGRNPTFQSSNGGGDNNNETIDLGSTTTITSTKRMFQPPDGDNEEAMGIAPTSTTISSVTIASEEEDQQQPLLPPRFILNSKKTIAQLRSELLMGLDPPQNRDIQPPYLCKTDVALQSDFQEGLQQILHFSKNMDDGINPSSSTTSTSVDVILDDLRKTEEEENISMSDRKQVLGEEDSKLASGQHHQQTKDTANLTTTCTKAGKMMMDIKNKNSTMENTATSLEEKQQQQQRRLTKISLDQLYSKIVLNEQKREKQNQEKVNLIFASKNGCNNIIQSDIQGGLKEFFHSQPCFH